MKKFPAHPQQRDHELVAEQPGFFLGLVLVVVALIIGFWIKSWIGSAKLEGAVRTAAQQIHPQLQVNFSFARISLADGWLPELALHLETLALEISDPCWMSPTLELLDLKLPVNLWALLRGEFIVQNAYINELKVVYRGSPGACPKFAPSSGFRFDKDKVLLSSGQDLFKGLKIRRLLVYFQSMPEGFLNFRDFEVQIQRGQVISSRDPFLIVRSAVRWGADIDTATGVVSSGQLELAIPRDGKWDLKLKGVLRESSYFLSATIDPRSFELEGIGNAKHFPLSQVHFPLRRMGYLKDWDMDLKDVWANTQVSYRIPLMSPLQANVNVHQLRVEGQSLQFETSPFVWSMKGPSAFTVGIEKLDLDKNFPRSLIDRYEGLLRFVSKRGSAMGQLQFSSHQNWYWQGQIHGSEVSFHRGETRKPQNISSMAAEWKCGKDLCQGKAGNFKLTEGVLLGDVALVQDLSKNSLLIRADIQELTLSGSVQKFLSFGGYLGYFTGNLHVNWNDKGQDFWTLDGMFDKAWFEPVELKRLKVSYRKNPSLASGGWRLTSNAGEIQAHQSEPWVSLLASKPPGNGMTRVGDLAAEFSSSDDRITEWRWSMKDVVGGGLLSSTGVLYEDDQVDGQVQIRKSAQSKKFMVKGPVTRPRIELIL